MQGKFLIGFVVAGLGAAHPALAADSILNPARSGPCAEALEGPDYVPGVDAAGRPVPRADAGAQRVPVPDQVYVPLPGGRGRGGRGGPAGAQAQGPYAAIDGHRLEPLVNPEACPTAPPPARTRR